VTVARKIENWKAGSQIWQRMLEEPTDFPKVGTVKCLEVGLLEARSDLKSEEVKTNTLVVLNIKKKERTGTPRKPEDTNGQAL
jgi:hypothetical protein